jgi:hypothetical protein
MLPAGGTTALPAHIGLLADMRRPGSAVDCDVGACRLSSNRNPRPIGAGAGFGRVLRRRASCDEESRPGPTAACLLAVVAIGWLSGCSNVPGEAKPDAGGASSVLSGAFVGGRPATNEGGGTLENGIGASLDERDRQRAYAAECRH